MVLLLTSMESQLVEYEANKTGFHEKYLSALKVSAKQDPKIIPYPSGFKVPSSWNNLQKCFALASESQDSFDDRVRVRVRVLCCLQ